jgi:hypothetical protein
LQQARARRHVRSISGFLRQLLTEFSPTLLNQSLLADQVQLALRNGAMTMYSIVKNYLEAFLSRSRRRSLRQRPPP